MMRKHSKIVNYWANLEAGKVYHFYNHAVGSDNLFKEHANYSFFLSKWEKYFGEYMDIYAYCLMPNHFHVLGRLKPLTSQIEEAIREENTAKALAFLSGELPESSFYESQFKRFFTSYSRAFGKKYNRVGSLFRAKFKRTLISNKERLLYMMYYIHHNPIHHGFCKTYEEWPYCSYTLFLEETEGLLHFPILRYFGDTREEIISNYKKEHDKFRLNFTP